MRALKVQFSGRILLPGVVIALPMIGSTGSQESQDLGSPHLCDIYRTILIPEHSCRFGLGPENYSLQAVFSGTPAPPSRSLESAYFDLCYMVFYNNVQNTQLLQHLGDGG